MRGLIVHVLRPADMNQPGKTDCTNGGITMNYGRFVLTGDGVDGPFEPDADTPELRLVARKGLGRGGTTYLHAVPVYDTCGQMFSTFANVQPGIPGAPVRGGMMGGNFVTTSDSRFPSDYPIPVHDRFEGAVRRMKYDDTA